LRFHGGKGVSTALGVLLALSWPLGLAALALWVAVLAATRISSLAALVSSAATPLGAYLFVSPEVAEIAGVLAVLIWARHIGNIRRLLRGEESRVGSRG
jgi:glycerol-3-phosphate acyltransferase PlsY